MKGVLVDPPVLSKGRQSEGTMRVDMRNKLSQMGPDYSISGDLHTSGTGYVAADERDWFRTRLPKTEQR